LDDERALTVGTGDVAEPDQFAVLLEDAGHEHPAVQLHERLDGEVGLHLQLLIVGDDDRVLVLGRAGSVLLVGLGRLPLVIIEVDVLGHGSSVRLGR
jgi:hypothetical protein